jgi:hypothetical protein
VLSLLGVVFAAGLLLGSELLLDEVFDELPGRALLFWSPGSVAVPLSSVDWLFGVVVVLLELLVPVPVAVWARAPNAASANAAAAVTMSFIRFPPGLWGKRWRSSAVNPRVEGPLSRSAKREGAARPPPSRPSL